MPCMSSGIIHDITYNCTTLLFIYISILRSKIVQMSGNNSSVCTTEFTHFVTALLGLRDVYNAYSGTLLFGLFF